MIKTSLILFDIGNVLVKHTGASIIKNLSKRKLSKEYVWSTWTTLKGVIEFETGKSNADAFSNCVIDFYDLDLDSIQFLKLFRSAAECKFDGVDKFLQKLSKDYTLACLTSAHPETALFRNLYVRFGF